MCESRHTRAPLQLYNAAPGRYLLSPMTEPGVPPSQSAAPRPSTLQRATLPRELREEEFADLVARVCRRVLIFHTAGEDISFYEKHFKTFHQKDIGNTRIFYMQKRDCDEEFRTPRDL